MAIGESLLDGLDRVGATIVAVSVIGGLLAPVTNAMTSTAAWTGVSIGLFAILVGGYLKDRVDAILKNVREVLSGKAEETETEASKAKPKEDGS
ncbi:hypothetical protein HSBAA_30890 [Vreelandella sulfidaeris]|uniref:Uncharacterized protein n=1 Tax=Vreelandella sulfidaeris TaxID=115553 RepID=A0A455U964_9GAMM|nr:hypothetical protein HSBAA_30890 [Halomonas sulfidaeris]